VLLVLISRFVEAIYPDSVSLVRPPNTTIPKTDAALPNNQYATGLEVVFGKNSVILFPLFLGADLDILWARWLNGEELLADALVLFNRTFLYVEFGNT